MQVAGRRGGPAPKVEKFVKEGHVAWTACGPAEGPMMPPLWTFAGERSVKSLAKGAPDAVWQKTPNGWPDVETVRVFAEMLVAEKKKRNLARILLFSDNADIHTDLEVINLFRKNSIKHVGLIHGASSYHQPLDRGFFDMVKVKIGAFAQKNDITLCYDNIAGVLHNVLAELEEAARKRGSSVLRRGFADTGLHPFNPDVFTDEVFAPSDLRLGIVKGGDEHKAAIARGEAYGMHAIAEIVAGVDGGSSARFEAAAEANKEIRAKQFAAAAKPFDPTRFAQRHVYTHEKFVEEVQKKEEAKQAEIERLAASRVAKAERSKQKAIEDAEKAKRRVERKNDKAAKTAAKEAAKEAQKKAAAAHLALGDAPGALKVAAGAQGKGKKRARAEGGDPYAKVFEQKKKK